MKSYETTKKKRIGLYARVSTEMQTDGYSIQGQLNDLDKYRQFQDMKSLMNIPIEAYRGKTMQCHITTHTVKECQCCKVN